MQRLQKEFNNVQEKMKEQYCLKYLEEFFQQSRKTSFIGKFWSMGPSAVHMKAINSSSTSISQNSSPSNFQNSNLEPPFTTRTLRTEKSARKCLEKNNGCPTKKYKKSSKLYWGCWPTLILLLRLMLRRLIKSNKALSTISQGKRLQRKRLFDDYE